MRLAIPSLILLAYVFISLVWPMPWRLTGKVLAAMLLLAVSMKFMVYEILGGAFFAPDLPRWFLLCAEALYATLVILFVLLLLKDLTALLLWASRCLGTTWFLPFSSAVRGTGLVLVALFLGMWGTWQAVRVPDVRTVSIVLPNLPASLDGFTIVQLSDIHIGPLLKGDWLQGVVDATNALNPDMVAITGDFIDGSPDKLRNDLAPLGDLRAKHGVFGVTGNHEYYFDVTVWLPEFERLGVNMLHNEHRVLTVDGAKLVIAGIPDSVAPQFGHPGPNVTAALAGTENTAKEAVRILLAHQPRGVGDNTAAHVQLSGHTHGGIMFFMHPLIAYYNGGYVAGLYNVDGMQLYMSSGTGLWNGFSSRVGVPSEITRVILQSRKADKSNAS